MHWYRCSGLHSVLWYMLCGARTSASFADIIVRWLDVTLQARQLPENTWIYRRKSSAYLKISEKNTRVLLLSRRHGGVKTWLQHRLTKEWGGCYRGTLENTDHRLFRQLCCVVIVHCVFRGVGALAVNYQSLPLSVFHCTTAFKTVCPRSLSTATVRTLYLERFSECIATRHNDITTKMHPHTKY